MAITPASLNTVQRPLIYLLLAYLTGIVCGYYFSIDRLILILVIIPMLLVATFSLHFKHNFLSRILLLGTCSLLGNLLFTSELSPHLPPNHLFHYLTDRKLVIEGVLYKTPQVFPAKTRYYVLARKIIEKEREISVAGKLLLTVHHTHDQLRYGDVVRFSCIIRLPKNFNNPGSFNYQRFLAFQGIFVTASLDKKHNLVKVGKHPVNPLLYRVESCRTEIKNFFTSHLSTPAAEIATALITGEQSGIAQEMRDQFSITGVAHILAISGLNINIIALISLALVKALCRRSVWLILITNISKLSALITLVPVVLYCLIAGAGIATVRATGMVIIYLMAIIIDRQDDLWNTLALAAFVILICSPSSLFDCSFQLSFVSVAAILYLNPRLSISFFKQPADFPQLRRPWYIPLAKQAMAVITVTLSAMLGTAPLVALYFNRCSPWGIPANIIVVPLTGFLVVPLGLLSSFLLFIARPLAVATAEIMEVLLNLSNATVKFFSTMPYADCRTTTPTLLELILYYAGLFLLFRSKRTVWSRYALGLVGALFIINGGYWYYQGNLSPLFRITSIDVGQGEATLLQLPKGKTMLIDGGGSYDASFDIGAMVVAPLLWKKKIRRIDVVVLSHPHPDHLNGLVSVMKTFSIGEVWSNGESIETDSFKAFEDLIADKGIRKTVITRGHPSQSMNGVVIEFLHPGQHSINKLIKGSHDRMNNNSLAMRLTYREVDIIFTGDINAAAESEIIAAFPGLTATILKIPHHGSITSSSKPFLEKLSPRIALLSVGSDNSFKLPHPDVIKRYEDLGCRILRTDEDGAVSLETDGSWVHIKPCLQRKKNSSPFATR